MPQPGIGLALIGATYGVIGYLFGKVLFLAGVSLVVQIVAGNPWAALLIAPALAAVVLVWMSARGLAGALRASPWR